jgi:hypothetical protein
LEDQVENTQESNVVGTLLDNAVAESIAALHTIQRLKDLVGNDPRGIGRDLAVAYTHIEDGALRLGHVQRRESGQP